MLITGKLALDRIVSIVNLTAYIASSEGLNDQSKVIDGASKLLERVFGANGRHTRAAVGVYELPGAPVEISHGVEVQPRYRRRPRGAGVPKYIAE